MSGKQRQLIREQILLSLHAASPVSLPTETIRDGLRIVGFRMTSDEVRHELEYLQGKDLIRMQRATLSRHIKRWRITSFGVDYLEEEDLA